MYVSVKNCVFLWEILLAPFTHFVIVHYSESVRALLYQYTLSASFFCTLYCVINLFYSSHCLPHFFQSLVFWSVFVKRYFCDVSEGEFFYPSSVNCPLPLKLLSLYNNLLPWFCRLAKKDSISPLSLTTLWWKRY